MCTRGYTVRRVRFDDCCGCPVDAIAIQSRRNLYGGYGNGLPAFFGSANPTVCRKRCYDAGSINLPAPGIRCHYERPCSSAGSNWSMSRIPCFSL